MVCNLCTFWYIKSRITKPSYWTLNTYLNLFKKQLKNNFYYKFDWSETRLFVAQRTEITTYEDVKQKLNSSYRFPNELFIDGIELLIELLMIKGLAE